MSSLLSRDTLLPLSSLPELLHCREAAVGPWLRERGIVPLRGPGRWEPLLVGRTVLYGLVRKTRVYVALEGEKVVAMVADGTQRWRE